jgi:hypothetical protein
MASAGLAGEAPNPFIAAGPGPDLSASLEGIMEFSSLFDTLTTTWGDEILVWAVAAVAGCICLIAVVNVLDMFLDNNEMG